MPDQSASKRGPGSKPWATNEQLDYLKSIRPAYTHAQSSGTGAEFWATVLMHWETTWTISDAPINKEGTRASSADPSAASNNGGDDDEYHTDDDKGSSLTGRELLLRRIKTWFNNHTRGSAATEGRRKLLDLSGKSKKKKKLSFAQAYTKLYWKEKLERSVYERWKEHWIEEHPEYATTHPEHHTVKKKTIPKPGIAFRNRIVRELFDEESPDVKSEVKAYREKTEEVEESDTEGNEELDAAEIKRRKHVGERQSAIDALPPTLDRMLDEIFEQTGLIGSVFFVGPEPQQGGKDVLIALHKGPSTGATIMAANLEICQAFQSAYINFSAKVFPPSLRRSLASPGTENLIPSRLPTAVPSLAPSVAAVTPSVPLPPPDRPGTSTASRSKAQKRSVSIVEVSDSDGEVPVAMGNREAHLDVEVIKNWAANREANRATAQGLRDQLANDWKELNAQMIAKQTEKKSTQKQAEATAEIVRCESTAQPASERTAVSPPLPTVSVSALIEHPVPASTSLSPSPASPVCPPPATIPPWLRPLLPSLQSLDNGMWKQLLDKFLIIEALLGFPDGQGKANTLSRFARPKSFDVWIKSGRQADPILSDLLSFKGSWKKWWVSLQPVERKDGCESFDDLVRDELEDVTWTELSKGGLNGFFSIIVSLSWWLKVGIDREDQLLELEGVFKDVLWVEDQIIQSLQSQVKRTSEGETSTSMKRHV